MFHSSGTKCCFRHTSIRASQWWRSRGKVASRWRIKLWQEQPKEVFGIFHFHRSEDEFDQWTTPFRPEIRLSIHSTRPFSGNFFRFNICNIFFIRSRLGCSYNLLKLSFGMSGIIKHRQQAMIGNFFRDFMLVLLLKVMLIYVLLIKACRQFQAKGLK